MNFNLPGQHDGAVRADGIARRRFLGAAGAAGTAAAAAAVIGSGRAGASTRPDRPHRTRQPSAGRAQPDSIGAAGTGLVGATVQPAVGSTTTRMQAATNFNNNLNPAGSPLSRPLATTVQKVYFKIGQFPDGTPGNQIPTYVTGLNAAGCKLILCYKPAAGGGDATSLKNSLAAMNNAGINGTNANVVLWQEVQNTSNGISAPDFQLMITKYYGPIVTAAGFPLVYDASYDQGYNGISSYFVAGGYFAAMAVDLYANMYWSSNNWNLAQPMAIADGTNPPTPFGVYEFGVTANGQGIPSYAGILSFYQYVLQTMTTRLTNNKTNADVIYYDLNGGAGDIATTTDYAISSLQAMFDTLSSSSGVTTP